jgi:hypothetical protein
VDTKGGGKRIRENNKGGGTKKGGRRGGKGGNESAYLSGMPLLVTSQHILHQKKFIIMNENTSPRTQNWKKRRNKGK